MHDRDHRFVALRVVDCLNAGHGASYGVEQDILDNGPDPLLAELREIQPEDGSASRNDPHVLGQRLGVDVDGRVRASVVDDAGHGERGRDRGLVCLRVCGGVLGKVLFRGEIDDDRCGRSFAAGVPASGFHRKVVDARISGSGRHDVSLDFSV